MNVLHVFAMTHFLSISNFSFWKFVMHDEYSDSTVFCNRKKITSKSWLTFAAAILCMIWSCLLLLKNLSVDRRLTSFVDMTSMNVMYKSLDQ